MAYYNAWLTMDRSVVGSNPTRIAYTYVTVGAKYAQFLFELILGEIQVFSLRNALIQRLYNLASRKLLVIWAYRGSSGNLGKCLSHPCKANRYCYCRPINLIYFSLGFQTAGIFPLVGIVIVLIR